MIKMQSKVEMEALVDFHFKSLQGTYFSEYIESNGYVLLFSDLVEDNYYNYIAQTKRNINEILAEGRPQFKTRNRKVALYVTPSSNLYNNNKSIPEGFKQWSVDAYMILDDPTALMNYKTPSDVIVEPVPYEKRGVFVDTFQRAYGGDNPSDPYANLPEYYSKSLRRSFDNHSSAYRMDYVWSKINQEPVGIAQMLSDNKIAGIYSVGTVSQYRERGIGKSIMSYLCKLAKDLGVANVMLQTESGSKVESWYKHMGFVTVFVAKYYVES
jgi:ribosomal protein S18 acetylase RimI-like enzyme